MPEDALAGLQGKDFLVKFGVKQGEAPAFDSESGQQGSYIKYFKDAETRLRFLEDVTDWTEVWMHFSQSKSRDYPCTGSKSTCPGCNHENQKESRASKRYIVNALGVKSGYVDLYKIPVSIIEDLIRLENNDGGSIQKRDYTILKFQKDDGTKYGVDKEDRDQLDLTEHKKLMKDHQEALADAFREVWGGLPEEDGYSGGDLYELPISKAGYLQPQPLKKVEKVEFPDDPPSEPAAQRDEEQQEISEAQLRSMSEDQITEVYKRAGVRLPDSWGSKDALVDRLIAALS